MTYYPGSCAVAGLLRALDLEYGKAKIEVTKRRKRSEMEADDQHDFFVAIVRELDDADCVPTFRTLATAPFYHTLATRQNSELLGHLCQGVLQFRKCIAAADAALARGDATLAHGCLATDMKRVLLEYQQSILIFHLDY